MSQTNLLKTYDSGLTSAEEFQDIKNMCKDLLPTVAPVRASMFSSNMNNHKQVTIEKGDRVLK